DKGKLIRTPVKAMSIISRNTHGVKLINCDPKEKLIAVGRVPEQEEEDDDGQDDEYQDVNVDIDENIDGDESISS
ncbi:MAG: hypothetical protein KAR45_12265, partial [Desulfobacteraceae bacterium]|nr:hypothetical protein [Desulfobacteraceae bacterium]